MALFFRFIETGSEALRKAKEKILYYPKDKAFWVLDLNEEYRPGAGILKNRVFVAFEFDEEGQMAIKNPENWIYSEDASFMGESRHPYLVIVKTNERGAYGLGAKFKAHLKVKSTRLATKAELAKVLGLSELELVERMKKQKW